MSFARLIAATLLAVAAPAAAADRTPAVTLARCDRSLGTIAIADGEVRDWTDYRLASPAALIAALARQSGCFSLYDPTSGRADYVVTASAGDRDAVIPPVAKAAAEAPPRPGTVVVTGRRAKPPGIGAVPVVGGTIGIFDAYGPATVHTAALQVTSWSDRRLLAAGTGHASKPLPGRGGVKGDLGGYARNHDGQVMASAFILAFNAIVAKADALRAGR